MYISNPDALYQSTVYVYTIKFNESCIAPKILIVTHIGVMRSIQHNLLIQHKLCWIDLI